MNHTYGRGALAYLAACYVLQATAFARTEPTAGSVSFMTLVIQVMNHEPPYTPPG